ncbi:MAG TPA: gamma-glutamyl-gamma-aminobutyrate hydrolase family protein [Chloroflexia bacterium]|nr:gamma-glutamyl-gamma-aminobutyrate hydrolase family protein [Chloroflexia bacterium]
MDQLDIKLKEKPVIGISGDILIDGITRRHTLRDSYVSAILAAGGAPFIIPAVQDEAATYALYRCLDGLLLTGGGDVDPSYYNEPVTGTETDGIQPARDSSELLLARWALADNLPVLGICRGHQVLNVALGGTLYQDIPSDMPESPVDHRGSTYTEDRGLLTHSISIAPGCKLSAIFGTDELQVNSLHHQGVKQAAEGLRVVATSPDGIAEALESPAHDWVLSVQWHPEELWRKQNEAASLFKAFVEFVAQRKELQKRVTV